MLDQPNLPEDDLNHSELLDVHTSSDYPEVNTFIHRIVKPPSYVPPCSTVSGTGGLMLSA